MLDYKKLVVLVDDSDLDGIMLRYISHFLNDQLSTKMTLLYFLPPEGDSQVLEYLRRGDMEPAEIYRERRNQIAENLNVTYRNALDSWRNIDLEIIVKEDNSKNYILKEIKGLEPDLIVMGKKDLSQGSGKIVKLITRNLPVDTLMIPKETPFFHEDKNIGFAIDFSDAGKYLLQRIYNLKEYKPTLVFEGFHVLNMVPIDYTMYNVHKEILRNQIQELEEKFDELLVQYDLKEKNVSINFDTNLEHSLIHKIYENAVEKDVAMIMIAPKKHTAVGRFLLGSVTEGLFEISEKMPICVIH